MDIPYGEFDLKVTLWGLSKKLTEEKIKEVGNELTKASTSNNRELNKKVAEFHKITLKELMNSPKYKVLRQKYAEDWLKKMITVIMEKFKITEKEAYAIIALNLGLFC